jgi:FixJ family two-component response regulator
VRENNRQAMAMSGSIPFLGRKAELEALGEWLAASSEGAGGLYIVTGEAGIGKTRLIERFTYALTPGAVTVWGRCHRDPDVPPYWPWLGILRACAERRDDTTLRSELGAAAQDIVPLVPELAERFPEFASPPDLEPSEARSRLFDGVHSFLRRAAARAPHVVVLDDVHWIDAGSLALLEYLVSHLGDLNVLFIASYRDLRLAVGSDAAAHLGAVTRYGRRLALEGLHEHDVRELMIAVSGHEPPSAVSNAMHFRTRGNPLFIEQMSRLIGARHSWGDTDVERLRMPTEIHSVVRERVATLSAVCRGALSTAAVIGKTFELDVFARAMDCAPEAALELLNAPISARLVEKARGALREYSFTHALIREVLYEDLSLLDRARTHERIARAILATHERDLDAHLSSLAHHFVQAAEVCDPAPVLDFCTRAGDRALSIHAYDVAADHYRRALDALALTAHDDERRGRLLLRLGEAQRHARNEPEARASFAKAAAIGDRIGDAELFGRAALKFAGPMNVGLGQIDAEIVSLLERAVPRVDGRWPELRSRLLARHVHELWFVMSREVARSSLDEALRLAEASGDANAIAHTYNVRHLALWDDDDVDERAGWAKKIVALRGRADREVVLEGYAWLIGDELERGDVRAWEQNLLAFEQYAKEVRQPLHLTFAALRAAAKNAMEGRTVEAEFALLQGVATDPGPTVGAWMLAIVALRRDQGRLAEAEDMVRAAAAAASSFPGMRYLLAYELALVGAPDAEVAYRRIAANQFADMPTGVQRLLSLAASAEACCVLGTAEEARAMRELLLPIASRHVQVGNFAAYWDSVAHLLGLLAMKLEDWDEAELRLSDALSKAESIGAACRRAYVQMHLAQALLARGRAEDLARMTALLDSAGPSAERLGLSGLSPRIEALRSRVDETFSRKAEGLDRITVFSIKFGLTPAQRRVFTMLVEGLAPKEIAAHLRVSHTTVRRHAEDIHRKCGVSSQRETLALFARTMMDSE